ncbi:MAG: hypothetical protein WCT85_04360 [Parachlamydiales bacterium]
MTNKIGNPTTSYPGYLENPRATETPPTMFQLRLIHNPDPSQANSLQPRIITDESAPNKYPYLSGIPIHLQNSQKKSDDDEIATKALFDAIDHGNSENFSLRLSFHNFTPQNLAQAFKKILDKESSSLLHILITHKSFNISPEFLGNELLKSFQEPADQDKMLAVFAKIAIHLQETIDLKEETYLKDLVKETAYCKKLESETRNLLTQKSLEFCIESKLTKAAQIILQSNQDPIFLASNLVHILSSKELTKKRRAIFIYADAIFTNLSLLPDSSLQQVSEPLNKALRLAVSNHHEKIASDILQYFSSKVNFEYHQPIKIAVDSYWDDMEKKLLEAYKKYPSRETINLDTYDPLDNPATENKDLDDQFFIMSARESDVESILIFLKDNNISFPAKRAAFAQAIAKKQHEAVAAMLLHNNFQLDDEDLAKSILQSSSFADIPEIVADENSIAEPKHNAASFIDVAQVLEQTTDSKVAEVIKDIILEIAYESTKKPDELLESAIRNGCTRAALTLIENDDVPNFLLSALLIILNSCHPNKVKTYLKALLENPFFKPKKNPEVNSKVIGALKNMIYDGQFELVKYILERTELGSYLTLLETALTISNNELAEKILDKFECSPQENLGRAFLTAVKLSNFEIVKKMLSSDDCINLMSVECLINAFVESYKKSNEVGKFSKSRKIFD